MATGKDLGLQEQRVPDGLAAEQRRPGASSRESRRAWRCSQLHGSTPRSGRRNDIQETRRNSFCLMTYTHTSQASARRWTFFSHKRKQDSFGLSESIKKTMHKIVLQNLARKPANHISTSVSVPQNSRLPRGHLGTQEERATIFNILSCYVISCLIKYYFLFTVTANDQRHNFTHRLGSLLDLNV